MNFAERVITKSDLGEPAEARVLSPSSMIEARFALGWSQREVAVRAGIAQSTISQIERGKRPLTGYYAKRIAPILNLHAINSVEPAGRSQGALSMLDDIRADRDRLRAQAETLAAVI